MKIIDVNSWERKKSYDWFSQFSNPTYHLGAKIDVSALINLKNEYKRFFFGDMLYLTVKALNSVPEMRLRIADDNVVEYDAPSPSFTVATRDGLFDICRAEWDDDPNVFCKRVRNEIDRTVKYGGNKQFGDASADVYYVTCLPWLDFETMSDPIPDDVKSLSIPRICWGKYVFRGGKYEMSLNITVNHALVDGKPLTDAFNAVQSVVNDCRNLLIK